MKHSITSNPRSHTRNALLALVAIAASPLASAQTPCLARFQNLYTGSGTVVSASVDEGDRVALLIDNGSGVDECQVFDYVPALDQWAFQSTFTQSPTLSSGGIDVEGSCIVINGFDPVTSSLDVYVYGEDLSGAGTWVPGGALRGVATGFANATNVQCNSVCAQPLAPPSAVFGFTRLLPINGQILALVSDSQHTSSCWVAFPSGFRNPDGAVWWFDVTPDGTGQITPTTLQCLERPVQFNCNSALFSESRFGAGLNVSQTNVPDEARVIIGAPGQFNNNGTQRVGATFIYEVRATAGGIVPNLVATFGGSIINANMISSAFGSWTAISSEFAFSFNPNTGQTRQFRREEGPTLPPLGQWTEAAPALNVEQTALDADASRLIAKNANDELEHYTFAGGAWNQESSTIPGVEFLLPAASGRVAPTRPTVGNVVDLARYDCGGALEVYTDFGATASAGLTPNATGAVGNLTLSGSYYVQDQNLTLSGTAFPANSFGILFVGDQMAPASTNGVNILTGSAVARLGVLQTSPTGTFTFPVDLTTIPPSNLPAMIGDTLAFQLIHRDPTGSSTPVIKGSEGVSLILQ